MLFLLTGDIQIGKTRWLDQLVSELIDADVPCYGVIAPGVWVKSSGPNGNEQGFEKLGIDNRLLPSNKTIRFADRIDIAKDKGTYEAESEAGKAQLGWHIYDDALAEVNEYLASIPRLCHEGNGYRGLLIIDELGRLELNHNCGLIEGVKLLEAGPQGCITDALLVVRETLVQKAAQRFASPWGGALAIAPKLEAANRVKDQILGKQQVQDK